MNIHTFWLLPTYPLLGSLGTMANITHPEGDVYGMITRVEITALGAELNIEDDNGEEHKVFITRLGDVEGTLGG